MMGPRQEAEQVLFYEFSLEDLIAASVELAPLGKFWTRRDRAPDGCEGLYCPRRRDHNTLGHKNFWLGNVK